MFFHKLKLVILGGGRSYRRKLLDTLLADHSRLMRGVVVDLAGKNVNHRGNFRPPTEQIEQRIVVNLDPDVEPDVMADIRDTGLDDGIADCVVLAETLQHVPSPESCVSEAHRLLKSGGVLIGSIPFLYPVHRDPADLIRLGPDGLELLLEQFGDVKIYSMGKFLGVIGLMLERRASTLSLNRIWTALGLRAVLKAALILISRLLTAMDRKPIDLNNPGVQFTTGYFFTGIKR